MSSLALKDSEFIRNVNVENEKSAFKLPEYKMPDGNVFHTKEELVTYYGLPYSKFANVHKEHVIIAKVCKVLASEKHITQETLELIGSKLAICNLLIMSTDISILNGEVSYSVNINSAAVREGIRALGLKTNSKNLFEDFKSKYDELKKQQNLYRYCLEVAHKCIS